MYQLLRGASVIAATLTVGVTAGLFFSFFHAVMPGLGAADDRTFVSAMQRINVAILNGWFAVTFGGALLLTGLAVALHLGRDARSMLPWLVAAFLLYAAVIAVTMTLNVPLNNAIDAAGDPGRIADLAAVRERFEAPWVRWNTVRAVLNVAAFGCLTWALVLYGRLSAGSA
jgi:uncharacterized membrane protein